MTARRRAFHPGEFLGDERGAIDFSAAYQLCLFALGGAVVMWGMGPQVATVVRALANAMLAGASVGSALIR